MAPLHSTRTSASWDTSSVTDHGDYMFYGATSFNQDISKLEHGRGDEHADYVLYSYFLQPGHQQVGHELCDEHGVHGAMAPLLQPGHQQVGHELSEAHGDRMFQGATSFNQDISGWNTAAVTNMQGMFYEATSFNQDISKWSTGSVTDMKYMFYGATGFDRDLSAWNVANVGSTCGEFDANAVKWSQPKPALPDSCIGFRMAANGVTVLCPDARVGDRGVVNGVAYMKRDRDGLRSLVGTSDEAELAKSCTTGVTDMSSLFRDATSFNQDISKWDTAAVTNMQRMFSGATSFNNDISKWNTAAVTNMEKMFEGTRSFNQDISKWNTGSVTDMKYMFDDATSFNRDISKWNTGSVTDMKYMFYGAIGFNRDLSSWNVANVGSTCAYFDTNTDAWALPKPALPDFCTQQNTLPDKIVGNGELRRGQELMSGNRLCRMVFQQSDGNIVMFSRKSEFDDFKLGSGSGVAKVGTFQVRKR